MIFSDCFGDCSKGEFDLIVRGLDSTVKHELMNILLNMKPEDVIDITEMYFKQVTEDLNEQDN